MSNEAAAVSGRLQHLGVLRFAGADSLSFLQGQVSNDTRRLAQAQSLFAAYSNPQGRVISLLHLLPHADGALAIVPRELLPELLERLKKFVFRSKVRIDDAKDSLQVAGCHGAQGLTDAGIDAAPLAGTYVEHGGIGVAPVDRGANRYWLIVPADSPRGIAAAPDSVLAARLEHDWRLADIRAGMPQIYLATRESFVAQMLNLDLLDGISFSKGCYTGQEIIARTQHLGRIKRRLHRLRLPQAQAQAPWKIGDAVHLRDGRAGRITEVIVHGGETEALAVLNLLSEAEGASQAHGTIEAQELPLPYS